MALLTAKDYAAKATEVLGQEVTETDVYDAFANASPPQLIGNVPLKFAVEEIITPFVNGEV